MPKLTAKVDSIDWEGTIAAESADKGDVERLLRSEGKLDRESEYLVGVELYVGDDYGGRMRIPYVCALIAEGRDHDEAAENLESAGEPLPLRVEQVAVTMEEFVGLFKHFKLVLTRKDMNLAGRNYATHE